MHTFQRTTFVLLIVVGLLPVFAGCFYSRELSRSKREIERGYPDLDIDRRITLALGPRTIHTAGWIVRQVPEEETQQVASYLRHLDKVKVAIYDVDYYDDEARSHQAAVTDFERNGWILAVRAAEDDESVWVLYRADSRDTVRDIKVIVLSEEDLVIARIQGTLNELLEDLVADHNVIDDIF